MSYRYLAKLGLLCLAAACFGGRTDTALKAIAGGALSTVPVTILLVLMAYSPFSSPIHWMLLAALAFTIPIGGFFGAIGLMLRRRLAYRARVVGVSLWAAAIAFLFTGALTMPRAGVSVEWPDRHAEIRIERWGFNRDEWWLQVRTPGGRLSTKMWDNAGAFVSANIYRTPPGSLVVIGAGSIAAHVEIPAGAPPRAGSETELREGSDWTYLGTVSAHGDDFMWISASQIRECIPLYGAGSVPVRQEFQSSGSC